MNYLKLANISLEDNGVEKVEYELEIYGRIVDFSEIEKAAVKSEYQEQYELKRPNGTIRVRMTKNDEGTTYTQTTKTWNRQRNKRKEAELEVPEHMFEHFKRLADSGMIKRRYFIPFAEVIETNEAGEVRENLFWEVDVFEDRDGKRSDWCKIDLEGVPEDIDVPELPITLEQAITNQYGDRTKEEIELLTKLFKEEFLVDMSDNDEESDEE